ncbi:MAG: glycoside hydrolase N-terminal domain-containing protein [Ruminiclostridium sp.]|nr:glycoside hydrolase N-terminal domain-containing protein [Ruminiclostridium sp.]
MNSSVETIKNVIKFSTPGDMEKWEEYCLPIGNGYLGASFFGGINKERIVLNEKTLWTGGPSPYRKDYNGGNRAGAYESVHKVQKLLYENKYDEAVENLPMLTCNTGDGYGSYQLLCDAILTFSNINPDNINNYSRSLDLDKSLYTCSFEYEGAIHKREAFASYPNRVICMKFSSNKQRRVCLKLSLDKIQEGGKIIINENRLDYYGALIDNQLCYHSSFVIENNGGEVITSRDSIMVEHADSVTVYFTAATDYSDEYPVYRSEVAPSIIVGDILDKCSVLSFEELYKVHYDDYSSLFDRVKLNLNGINGEIPCIDTLIPEYRKGYNEVTASQLEALYFQFGRYMLISSSRDGSLPANLQGVWNESNCPPWCCDYHINVNLQMNYWGAYNTNLAETAKPLVRFLDKMRKPGRITAKEYYNIISDENNPENGWIAHTQATPFGWTSPGWDFYWGWSTAAVAWLMQNIWEYYEFTLDKDYLEKEIYPVMRESAKFYSQWLIYDDKQERLVSTPTYSPEHGPVSIGNTYEQSLIEQFYSDFINASYDLNADKELRDIISEQKEKLKPFAIGKWGQIKEWFEEDNEDFDVSKTQKNHRHISHLMGLYPGKTISSKTPELLDAAIVTMNDRGDESTGWSRAYKLNLWARTKDGNRAYKILNGLLSGCTYPNLFDFHPPFQLDGNFGGSAGIAELLLQSHEGYIEPLAALPENWKSGEFCGLCARNGFELSVKWNRCKVENITVISHRGGKCNLKTDLNNIRYNDTLVDFSANNGIISFDTIEGGVYKLGV